MDGHDYENGSDGKGEFTIIVACKTLLKVWNKTISLHLLLNLRTFTRREESTAQIMTPGDIKLYRVQFSTAQRLFKVKGRPKVVSLIYRPSLQSPLSLVIV